MEQTLVFNGFRYPRPLFVIIYVWLFVSVCESYRNPRDRVGETPSSKRADYAMSKNSSDGTQSCEALLQNLNEDYQVCDARIRVMVQVIPMLKTALQRGWSESFMKSLNLFVAEKEQQNAFQVYQVQCCPGYLQQELHGDLRQHGQGDHDETRYD